MLANDLIVMRERIEIDFRPGWSSQN
jgi:hypothetical protein